MAARCRCQLTQVAQILYFVEHNGRKYRRNRRHLRQSTIGADHQINTERASPLHKRVNGIPLITVEYHSVSFSTIGPLHDISAGLSGTLNGNLKYYSIPLNCTKNPKYNSKIIQIAFKYHSSCQSAWTKLGVQCEDNRYLTKRPKAQAGQPSVSTNTRDVGRTSRPMQITRVHLLIAQCIPRDL